MELGKWYSGVGRQPCNLCTEIWENADKHPPCDTCFPGIHPYNEATLTLYLDCQSQYIVGPTGVIGLDLTAANAIMDWHNVDNDERSDLWIKMNVIADALINECIQDAKEKAELEKQRGK